MDGGVPEIETKQKSRFMKHRILIATYSMGIGGVERALLALLQNLDYSKVNVTLKLAQNKGALLGAVPQQVNVSEIETISRNWELLNQPLLPQIISLSASGRILTGCRLLLRYVHFKLTGHYHSLFRCLLKKEAGEYDLAIAFSGPSSLMDYYVAHCVTSRKKVSWIHFDVDRCGINQRSELLLYKKFDKIFVVSEEGRRKFCAMFPKHAGKSEVFHNIIDAKEIRRRASAETVQLKSGVVNIVTVGRISKEKGQYKAVKVLQILKDRGYKVFWTLVGGGNYESAILAMADEADVRSEVGITGVVANPYPYMAQCDIYVQPSEHEGFCITLAEAKLFGMPAVAADFTGAVEQLADYKNGFVSGRSAESIAEKLMMIIDSGLYKVKNCVEAYHSDIAKLHQFFT